MCLFLFIGLSPRHEARLRAEMAGVPAEVAAMANASVVAAFPPGDVVRVVTRAGCSCDLCASRAARFDEAAERAKLRAKGWSAPKIERAIDGRRPAEDPRFAAFRVGFARVVRAAGSARVLVVDFGGDVEGKAVAVGPGERDTVAAYLARGGMFARGRVVDVVG